MLSISAVDVADEPRHKLFVEFEIDFEIQELLKFSVFFYLNDIQEVKTMNDIY